MSINWNAVPKTHTFSMRIYYIYNFRLWDIKKNGYLGPNTYHLYRIQFYKRVYEPSILFSHACYCAVHFTAFVSDFYSWAKSILFFPKSWWAAQLASMRDFTLMDCHQNNTWTSTHTPTHAFIYAFTACFMQICLACFHWWHGTGAGSTKLFPQSNHSFGAYHIERPASIVIHLVRRVLTYAEAEPNGKGCSDRFRCVGSRSGSDRWVWSV